MLKPEPPRLSKRETLVALLFMVLAIVLTVVAHSLPTDDDTASWIVLLVDVAVFVALLQVVWLPILKAEHRSREQVVKTPPPAWEGDQPTPSEADASNVIPRRCSSPRTHASALRPRMTQPPMPGGCRSRVPRTRDR
jgi:hypothetical protein